MGRIGKGHRSHVKQGRWSQITCTFDPMTKEIVHYKVKHRSDRVVWKRKGCINDS